MRVPKTSVLVERGEEPGTQVSTRDLTAAGMGIEDKME